ncbi:MAG: hypothetical protein PHT95_02230 [Candidatus Omnitrophica bacterium]|nr:hypothetical protein [Candidatus Omnitrophota bacterium]
MDIDTLIQEIRKVLRSYEASADKAGMIREIIDNAEAELKTQEEK